jgi:hypothetical protein
LLTLLHFCILALEKIAVCAPYNPSAEEVGGLDVFLSEAAQNFELFSNI